MLVILFRPLLQNGHKCFLIHKNLLVGSTDFSVCLLRMCPIIKAVDNEKEERLLALPDILIPTHQR